MAAVSTIIAGVGLGLSAAGSIVSYNAQKKRDAAEQKAERSRQKAMNLDAQRKKRAIIRDMQVARATALANATAQGGAESSSLQGGFAQISGQGNTNLVGVEQQQAIGNTIFAANRQASKASSQYGIGQAITSIGGQLIENRQEISRIGAYAFA